MGNPVPRDVRVDQVLTNVSLAYRNDETSYIAEKLAPLVVVQKDAAKIATYTRDNMRLVETLRAPGAQANETDFRVSIGDHYLLAEHALQEYVDYETQENAEKPIQPVVDATENITDKLWLKKEKALADVATDTAVITNNVTLAGVNQWSDYSGTSDPYGDVQTAIDTIKGASGKMANTLALSWRAYNKLLQHPAVIDKIKFVQKVSPEATASHLAASFGLQQVLVGNAQYESANEGQADSATLTDVWGKDALVCYVETTPRLKSRSLFKTYQKSGVQRRFDRWENQERLSTVVRGRDKFDQKLIDSDCGYLIKAAVA